MATPKRPRIPSFDEISASVGSTDKWLDAMLAPPPVLDEKEFEVEDTSAPAVGTTTSSDPAKPRTLKAGYDYKESKMVVVFRDGTWWEYRGVPNEMWEAFKSAESKGRYLRESGLDSWGDMGPADVTKMPRHQRVQMNSLQEFANYMYHGLGKTNT